MDLLRLVRVLLQRVEAPVGLGPKGHPGILSPHAQQQQLADVTEGVPHGEAWLGPGGSAAAPRPPGYARRATGSPARDSAD